MPRVVTLMTIMRGVPYWDRPWPDSWNTLVPARQGRGVRCPSPVDPGAEGSPGLQQFIAQTLNGLTLAGIIFLVSSGFTLVFGVMRVTNLSHGAVYLLGGYIGYSVISATHNFFYGLAAGALAMGVFGFLLERTLITWLKGNEMSELLATLGLIYVIDDISLAIWGGSPLTINLPGLLGRSVTLPVSGIVYPNTRIFILGVSAVIALGLYYLLRRTRVGAIIRAGVDDREMVSALGINVRRVFAL